MVGMELTERYMFLASSFLWTTPLIGSGSAPPISSRRNQIVEQRRTSHEQGFERERKSHEKEPKKQGKKIEKFNNITSFILNNFRSAQPPSHPFLKQPPEENTPNCTAYQLNIGIR